MADKKKKKLSKADLGKLHVVVNQAWALVNKPNHTEEEIVKANDMVYRVVAELHPHHTYN